MRVERIVVVIPVRPDIERDDFLDELAFDAMQREVKPETLAGFRFSARCISVPSLNGLDMLEYEGLGVPR